MACLMCCRFHNDNERRMGISLQCVSRKLLDNEHVYQFRGNRSTKHQYWYERVFEIPCVLLDLGKHIDTGVQGRRSYTTIRCSRNRYIGNDSGLRYTYRNGRKKTGLYQWSWNVWAVYKHNERATIEYQQWEYAELRLLLRNLEIEKIVESNTGAEVQELIL